MTDNIILSRKLVESATFFVLAYAASNPKWSYEGIEQDPSGAHATYEALKAITEQPVQPATSDSKDGA